MPVADPYQRFLGRRAPAVIWLAAALPAGMACAQDVSVVRVEGTVEKPLAATASEIRKQFAADERLIAYTLKGVSHRSHAVPLLAIIRAAGPRVRAAVKNHLQAFAVSVRARDGYTACFSLGELLPESGGREAWLAFDQDGQPLPEKEAPVELIVPADAKPARWVHAVQSIVLIDTVPDDRAPAQK